MHAYPGATPVTSHLSCPRPLCKTKKSDSCPVMPLGLSTCGCGACKSSPWLQDPTNRGTNPLRLCTRPICSQRWKRSMLGPVAEPPRTMLSQAISTEKLGGQRQNTAAVNASHQWLVYVCESRIPPPGPTPCGNTTVKKLRHNTWQQDMCADLRLGTSLPRHVSIFTHTRMHTHITLHSARTPTHPQTPTTKTPPNTRAQPSLPQTPLSPSSSSHTPSTPSPPASPPSQAPCPSCPLGTPPSAAAAPHRPPQ